MRRIVLAAAVLSSAVFAAPAQAALFKWNVDYTGFFAEDASISGFFVADEITATDGFVSGDEFSAWEWVWSGNSEVEAFTLSSSDGEIESFFGESGFFVDGTPNVPDAGTSEGVYISDVALIDLDFLFVDTFAPGAITSVTGDVLAAGTVSVSEIGRAAWWGRVLISVVAVSLKKKKVNQAWYPHNKQKTCKRSEET